MRCSAYKLVCLHLLPSHSFGGTGRRHPSNDMPARTPKYRTCRVVSGENESPCTHKAKWRGEGKPQLCALHQEEYVMHTIAYKVASEHAEVLYEHAIWLRSNRNWFCPSVCIGEVNFALRAAKRCLAALDEEIREREAHHRRFFGDGG